MRFQSLRAIAFLGLVPAATGACGFIFSHAPPAGHEQMDYFTCTESNAAPIIDVIDVIWAFVIQSDIPIASRLVFAGLSGVAAGVGFSKSRECRAAKRAWAQRQRAQGPGARRDPQAVDAVVQTVVLNPATDTLTIGERVQLGAIAYSFSGGFVLNRMFMWSSSNDAIASVSRAGLVTAHANGTVVIAANTDNVVGTANIVVAAR